MAISVHTLRRLKGIMDTWRYAGVGTSLVRREGDSNGAYTPINIVAALSGDRFSAEVYRPALTSMPYLFVADNAAMLKDNGTGQAQNWGIPGLPKAPVTTVLQPNLFKNIAHFELAGQIFGPINVSGFVAGTRVLGATLGTNVGGAALATATPSSMINILPNMLLVISPGGGNQETVQVISTTATTFTAYFQNAHTSSEALQNLSYGGSIGPSTSAAIGQAFQQAPHPVMAWNWCNNINPDDLLTPGNVLTFYAPAGLGFLGSPGTISEIKPGVVVLMQGFVNSPLQSGAIPSGLSVNGTFTVLTAGTSFVGLESTGGAHQDYFTVLAPGIAYAQNWNNTTLNIGTYQILSGVVLGGGGALDLSNFPSAASPDTDYIVIYFSVDIPDNLQQINLNFDVSATSPGTFTADYYTTTIIPAQIQGLVSGGVPAGNQALSQAVASRATGTLDAQQLGVVNSQLLSPDLTAQVPGQLSSGKSVWSFVQVQKRNFITVGLAGTAGRTWANVNSWQIAIVTTSAPTAGITIGIDDFYMMGGSGLSSIGGTAYDYRVTYYNANTGEESNPSRTQITALALLVNCHPVLISWLGSNDPQVTASRLYRRGGSINEGWDLVATIPVGTNTFLDTFADAAIVAAPQLAIDNDAPVTSTLLVSVATTLRTPATGYPATTGSMQTVSLLSTANVYVNQRLTIDTGDQQEVIYVAAVSAGTITAFFQNSHVLDVAVKGDTRPNTPMNLMAIAFDRAWVAGDKNNPHVLYYSKRFNCSAFPPQNTLEIGRPNDGITTVIEYRGLLYVQTVSRIYSIYDPGGSNPQVVATAEVTYGCVAAFGWCVGAGEIKYQAVDGIRRFSGGSSQLLTLNVDWLETGKTYGPIVPGDKTKFSQTLIAYYNREMYVSYIGIDGNRHRIIWSDDYSRFRNDDVPATALFVEADTNKLLYGDANGNIFQDRINDFDDGGIVGLVQVKNPIPFILQTAYLDQGKPKYQKSYQEFTIDIDTNGQTVAVQLLFNNGTGAVLALGTVNQTGRAKVNFKINNGLGQLGYNVSIKLTGSVIAEVTMREVAVKWAMETDTRKSFDTYWIDDNNPEWKMLKQGWFNYVTPGNSEIDVSIYTDGNMTTPEFTFVLPPTLVRQPLRVRFAPIKCRTYRFVAVSTGDFMWYSESFCEIRPLSSQKGYQRRPLQSAA